PYRSAPIIPMNAAGRPSRASATAVFAPVPPPHNSGSGVDASLPLVARSGKRTIKSTFASPSTTTGRTVMPEQPASLRRQTRAPDPGLYGIRLRRSEEHTSELQSRENLVCRLLL